MLATSRKFHRIQHFAAQTDVVTLKYIAWAFCTANNIVQDIISFCNDNSLADHWDAYLEVFPLLPAPICLTVSCGNLPDNTGVVNCSHNACTLLTTVQPEHCYTTAYVRWWPLCLITMVAWRFFMVEIKCNQLSPVSLCFMALVAVINVYLNFGDQQKSAPATNPGIILVKFVWAHNPDFANWNRFNSLP